MAFGVERDARAGKHVLCREAMATSLHDAEAMIDACRKGEQEADDCLSLPL